MNIKMGIQYDGTDFCGSQVQPDVRTVQEVLENALSGMLGTRVLTVFSGRTDSGVHAMEQVVNFRVSDISIPADKIIHPLNKLLPDDINALYSFEVPDDFNARFSAKKRTYRYFIRSDHDLFRRKYSLIHPWKIDIENLNYHTSLFTGRKDFRSFCSSHAEVNSYICNVFDLKFFRLSDEIVMEISADRFLQNMVRIIVSVFIELNRGNIDKEGIRELFEKKDRKAAPKTISPKGLFLWKVEY